MHPRSIILLGVALVAIHLWRLEPMAQAGTPSMEVEGDLTVQGFTRMYSQSNVVTSAMGHGFCHYLSGTPGAALYTLVGQGTDSGAGAGILGLANGTGHPFSMVLQGNGESWFNGGEVTIGDPASNAVHTHIHNNGVSFYSPPPYSSSEIQTGLGWMKFDVGGSPTMTISPGRVGIGPNDVWPSQELDVDGALSIRVTYDTPTPVAGSAIFYVQNENGEDRMWIHEYNRTATRLNSHADPRQIDPEAVCSMGDPSITLPFTFQHENNIIGKGAIVDLAKMAQYVEKKMQEELGEKGGRLVYVYDLPPEKTITATECEEEEVRRQAEEIADRLNSMPWIPVDLGANGAIPPEALEETPEMRSELQEVPVKESVIDYDAGRVVEVDRTQVQLVQVPTGRMTKKLKEGWKFEKGALYRKPTMDDIDISKFAKPVPPLPQWVLDRIPPSAQGVAQSSSDLLDRLKDALVALSVSSTKSLAAAERVASP
ncbi:MAG: hypothetical protein NTW86_29900 [Candidatus Sumerlaeota bacterium]|nr:hypothetical protein [Candidatus Sumerlaeota bacterium]